MSQRGYKTQLGVIGGSGVYQMDEAELIKEHTITTPFGEPSDKVLECAIQGKTVYFIPRHGRGHQWLPSEVKYQANIFALKTLGVTHVLAVSAVGIMREEIRPGDMVVPDQIFDRTRGQRPSTFFGNGIVGHVSFADPFSAEMRAIILDAARAKTSAVHDGGAYVCMEGPQFSTRAESQFYRKTLNPSVIGMTGLPEAKLAREAELCYGMLCLATDYDCWHESEADVAVEDVLKVLKNNAKLANSIVCEVVKRMPEYSTSPDLDCAKFAIITKKEALSPERVKDLEPLYGRYFRPL